VVVWRNMPENRIQKMIKALRILEPYAGPKTLFGAEHDLFYVYCLEGEIDDEDTRTTLADLGWFPSTEEPGSWETFV